MPSQPSVDQPSIHQVSPVPIQRSRPSPARDAGRSDGRAAGRTPYVELDIALAVTRFRRLAATLPGAGIHYPVRTNPHPELLAALARAGCRFDVASPAEVSAALEAGADPAELVYSPPVKPREDIALAARRGVRLFAVDSPEEIAKVGAAAPGSGVLCRIHASGEGSDRSPSRTSGCSPREAARLLRSAAVAGLEASGVAFHVGSQQRDPRAWDAPIGAAARVLDSLGVEDRSRFLLDIGGGFPARFAGDCPPLPSYGAAIEQSLRRHFADNRPRIMAGPGRAMVADAGTLVTTVVAVVRRGDIRRVFLDAGVLTGLVEPLVEPLAESRAEALAEARGEAPRHRIRTSADGGPTGPCVLAGTTRDSVDVLYAKVPVQLPLALSEGDTVRLLSVGASTADYATVDFHGLTARDE